ncbi:MAG: hypothetical protein ABIW03_05770 [Sphingomicrobium sp.]
MDSARTILLNYRSTSSATSYLERRHLIAGIYIPKIVGDYSAAPSAKIPARCAPPEP